MLTFFKIKLVFLKLFEVVFRHTGSRSISYCLSSKSTPQYAQNARTMTRCHAGTSFDAETNIVTAHSVTIEALVRDPLRHLRNYALVTRTSPAGAGVSVPRTKTFGLYSGDVSEVDKTMINPYIKSVFCYLL